MANTSPTPEKQEDKVGNTITEATVFAKIIAKNFLSLPSIARDLNVARQNIIKLVKLRGGESTNKADAMFLKSSEAETKLGVEKQKLTAKEVTPTPAEKEEVGMGEEGEEIDIASELVAVVIVGVIAGVLLDKLFSSKPLFLIICIILASISAFRSIWRKYIKIH
jgi:F0F1-type ATP synthase assembly protein I